MPVCVVCEGEDFDERDGLYFCQTCMTQSQDYRREEAEEEYIGFCAVSSQLVKKKSKETKETKEASEGRPWHTDEAFTIIIREQVKALIKLGASPLLKDVVKRLWFNYLSMKGAAFPEDESKIAEFNQKHMRHREKYPGSLKCPRIEPVRFKRTKLKNFGVSNKVNERNIENSQLASAVQNIEFYEGDHPVEDEDEGEVVDYSSEEEKDRSKLLAMMSEAEWMNMQKTLSFCYIGLLYTNNLVSISDLVRWTRHDRIPYYNATKLIPEEMKFNSYDKQAFGTRTLGYRHIDTDTKLLVKFLGLNDIPEVSLTAMTSKLIVMLDLPGELHGFVVTLIMSEIETELVPYNSVDIEAMAYIITTLQLLLGMDDSTERELSEIAMKLNAIFTNRYNMFVWSDWTTHISQKVAPFGSQDWFSDPRNVKDTQPFIDNFHLMDKDKKCSAYRSRHDKTVRPEMQEALLRPLETFQKNLQSSSDMPNVRGNSDLLDIDHEMEYDPFLEQTLADSSVVNNFLNPDKEKSNNMGNELQNNSIKYRSACLKFITQPLSFQDELQKDNLSSFTVQNSSDEDSDLEENLSQMDLFESPVKKSKRKVHKIVKQRQNLEDRAQQGSFQDKELAALINKLSHLHESTTVFEKREDYKSFEYQSRSYQWLVRLCSSWLGCRVEKLNDKVMEVQNTLFTNWDKSQWRLKKKMLSLLKR